MDTKWENEVVLMNIADILYKHVREQIAEAEAPEDDEGDGENDEEGPPPPVEPLDLQNIQFDKYTLSTETTYNTILGTYQQCSKRHNLFIDCPLSDDDDALNQYRTKSMNDLSIADKCIAKQLIISVLDVYYPMSGEAAERIQNLNINAEHLILETMFHDMLQLPNSKHPWVYYANVIAGLCKAKRKTYPPALAETVHSLFTSMGKGLMRDSAVENESNRYTIHLVDDAADRLSQWMAWHLNKFKWNWPFSWWEKSLATNGEGQDTSKQSYRGQEAFVAALCSKCTSISYAEKMKKEFKTWLHPYIDECSGIQNNPYLISSDNEFYRQFYSAIVADLKAGKDAGITNSANLLLKFQGKNIALMNEAENNVNNDDMVIVNETDMAAETTQKNDAGKKGKEEEKEEEDAVANSCNNDGKKSTLTNEHVRSCTFAILQSGCKTLTHLRSRFTRFKELLINLITIEGDDAENNQYNLEVVRAISDFWHLNPAMLMHSLNILIEYRVLNGVDVLEYFLLNSNTTDETRNKIWFKRYWPWEIMNSVLLRTFNKECIAEPRPYAGLHMDMRDKKTEEQFSNEKSLREKNYTKLKVAVSKCREEHCATEEERVVLNKRYECLLSTFYKVKEEFV